MKDGDAVPSHGECLPRHRYTEGLASSVLPVSSAGEVAALVLHTFRVARAGVRLYLSVPVFS